MSCNIPATHSSLHLRDAADAHIIFEAVRRGILPLLRRRLTADERDEITSGHVFVWEEAEHKGGLERWTDGRRWSQSRMKGDYLFYEEKIDMTEEERRAKAARRANKATDPDVQIPAPVRRQDRPPKPNGLTKQTYSTYIYPPNAEAPRKWHIVAYFFDNEYTLLPNIDNYDYLRSIKVPNGIFFSSKGMIRTAHPEFQDNYSSYSDRNSSIGSPVSYNHSLSPTEATHGGNLNWPSATYHQTQGVGVQAQSPLSARPHVQRAATNPSVTLPRLSALGSFLPHHGSSPNNSSPGDLYNSSQKRVTYRSLSPEDRRALDTFRVVL